MTLRDFIGQHCTEHEHQSWVSRHEGVQFPDELVLPGGFIPVLGLTGTWYSEPDKAVIQNKGGLLVVCAFMELRLLHQMLRDLTRGPVCDNSWVWGPTRHYRTPQRCQSAEAVETLFVLPASGRSYTLDLCAACAFPVYRALNARGHTVKLMPS